MLQHTVAVYPAHRVIGKRDVMSIPFEYGFEGSTFASADHSMRQQINAPLQHSPEQEFTDYPVTAAQIQNRIFQISQKPLDVVKFVRPEQRKKMRRVIHI